MGIKGKMYNVVFFMVRFLSTMDLEFIDQRPESVARTLTTMRGDFLDRGRIRRPGGVLHNGDAGERLQGPFFSRSA